MFITKKRILSLFLVLIVAGLQLSGLFQLAPARADSSLVASQGLLNQVGNSTYGSKQKDVKILALDILNVALGFLAFIFLALLLFAGFKWMTSNGNDSKIKESTGQIQAAAIGLLIVLASWGVARFIMFKLVCTTTTSGTDCSYWSF